MVSSIFEYDARKRINLPLLTHEDSLSPISFQPSLYPFFFGLLFRSERSTVCLCLTMSLTDSNHDNDPRYLTPSLSDPIDPGPESRYNQLLTRRPKSEEKITDPRSGGSHSPPGTPEPRMARVDDEHVPKMWNPVWFQKRVLVSMIALFAALVVALGLLCYFSNLLHGFTQVSKFSWKYGLTAVFVVLSSLWIQVDFWCKVLVPWQAMKVGGASADKTLLLDYVSSNPAVAARDAWRNEHWVVMATTLGGVLLQLLTILSTTLIAVRPTPLSHHNLAMLHTGRFANVSLGAISDGPLAIAAYTGIVTQGLPHPNGTFANIAYETIEPAGSLPTINATVRADTVAFFPNVNCEVAEVSLLETKTGWLNVSFKDSRCSFYYSWEDKTCKQSCGERQVLGLWDALRSSYRIPEVCIGEPNDHSRIIFAVIDQQFSKTTTGNNASDSEQRATTGVVCRPRYALRPAALTFKGSLANSGVIQSIVASPNGTESVISGVSQINITDAVWAAFFFSGNIISEDGAPDSQPFDDKAGLFPLMRAVNNGSSLSAFTDPSKLTKAATAVLEGVISQIVRQSLLSTTHGSPAAARVEYVETRLHPVLVPVWLTGAGLVLLMAFALAVIWFRPLDVVPCDPTSIAAIATVLASSPELNSMTAAKIHTGYKPLEAYFADTRFSTIVTGAGETPIPTFRIEPSQDSRDLLGPKLASETRAKWWQPLSTRVIFVSLVTVALIVIIVVLEVLQRLSIRHKGILSIDSPRTAQIFVNIIPAGVMVLVHIAVKSISSNLRIFVPFKTLYKSNASARQSILAHHLGAGSLPAIFEALRAHQPTVILSAAASLLASVLAIIVSTLYFTASVPRDSNVTLRRLDSFDLSWANQSNLTTANLVFNLLQHFNMSDPPFTYRDLVFPMLQLTDGDAAVVDSSNSSQQPVTAAVPAYRATLHCTIVPRPNMTVIISELDDNCYGRRGVRIYADVTLPEQCLSNIRKSTSETAIFTAASFCFQTNSVGMTAMGSIKDVFIDPSNTKKPFEYDPYKQTDNPEGCPSLAFIFGSYAANATAGKTSAETTTILSCRQQVERVVATTRFLGRELYIDQTRGPELEASATQPQVVGRHSYRLQTNFTTGALGFPGQDMALLDPFFQAVVWGPGGISPAGIADSEKALAVIRHKYAVYMAQALNSGMRRAAAPATLNTEHRDEESSFVATTPVRRDRLQQNDASKLTLQILLAVILLFVASARFLAGHLRAILPYKPFSVAGMVVLLAGSEVVERKTVPVGAEWMGEGRWTKEGVFDGWLFSLGWWVETGERVRRRRYGIGVGSADE
ncbi:hypothetical protein BCR34DRAFT_618710 [Clohesyomyces aquaticus]|uniref:Uncharacterized protein n=1 Tax=Clohesyomyces aquaticus TaxID=1231657 RepID=A0A1Y1YQR2_9PLEO|nr:hypothetical protein BCR34DRAFT_618710 [Clohesyomyces aquaticus]